MSQSRGIKGGTTDEAFEEQCFSVGERSGCSRCIDMKH